MFYLYHHHDLARLAEVLTLLRRAQLPSPLATDRILVPNMGLGRWLKMHIAEHEGIAANIQTVLPAPFFWDVIADSLPGERPDSSAYRRENLRWHLYALLPELAEEVPEVGRYLAERPAEVRRWQLAERLADLFDEYLIYRRPMLLAWERGADEATPPGRWQAPLWRALTSRLGRDHRARLLGELIQRVEHGEALDTTHWPERLYCFGLGNLPPDYLRLLYALGRHSDVHFLMHNPSDGYWGDIEKRPTALVPLDGELAAAGLPGEAAAFTGHPLLASLGYAARDFLRLIYSDEFADIRELELGEALVYHPPGEDTLLHRLQSGVITMDATPTTAGLDDDDASFQVHACHGALREVQVLHDQLLDLLAADETLEPREIIVMTPNVAEFAPAIEAVFGAAAGAAAGAGAVGTSAGNPRGRIPFNLSDRPRQGTHPIVLTFRTLLDLPLWRWTASEVLDLIAVPAVMRRYELEEADLANLQRWVASAGIRWGLDAEHRAHTGAGHWAQNSWAFGMDRLLAGVSIADGNALVDGVNPVVDLEGGASAALGELWLLLDRLRHWRGRLTAAASAADWQERLNALAADLFAVDYHDREEQAALDTVSEAVGVLATAARCLGDEPLSWEAVREILDGELSASGARQPFLAGGVTFCGLVPLRTVPFRVVCLIGMNDGAFPRRDQNRAINLIRRQPRLGDASVRDDDRLLLLQWLLAARDVFYVSYTGLDTMTGEDLEPSMAVAELLDFVAHNQFGGTTREDALERLVTRQPMQPFSPRYFEAESVRGRAAAPTEGMDDAVGAAARPRNLDLFDEPAGAAPSRHDRIFTFRQAWQPGALAMYHERSSLPSLVDGSRAPAPELEQITLDELKRFFKHPARYFLREVLQLDLETRAEQDPDEEPLAIKGLEEYELRQRLFDAVRSDGALPAEPPAVIRAQGLLPPPPLDQIPYRKAAGELNALLPVWEHMRDHAGGEVIAVDVRLGDGTRVTGRLGDVGAEGLCRVEARRMNASVLLPHWIDLLALAATGTSASLECCALDGDGGLDLRVGALGADEARAHLESLIEVYVAGQQRPLCFLPNLGLEFVEQISGADPAQPDDALDSLNRKLGNDFQPPWEVRDIWFRHVLKAPPAPLGTSAQTSEFCRVASTVLEPLASTLSPQDVARWLANRVGSAGRP
jgi:exodeoxyribonuclease V gamma subunit